ncbi:MAG: glycosyl transferase family protein [Acetobacteraceae bacterium]|nr:glycosyl transferase family protein [Acetobacteraceae bacterium]
MEGDAVTRFAPIITTLGRGPGRSRALTRDEAREAFGMVLAGEADPHQVGAFLMLLRYRGEDPDEIAGLVEAARQRLGLGGRLPADLDWPSYGAGRTRGAPWFLLSALALARAGVRVLMHGTNAYSSGMSVTDGLARLGLAPCQSLHAAERSLAETSFAYLPLSAFAPDVERLLALRRLFGLRSPVNTVSRLLDPASAPVGVAGVFHPAYIDVHLGAAERLGRVALAVVKGGGGEAERSGVKPVALHRWRSGEGRTECLLPAWPQSREESATDFASVWRGESEAPAACAATIALALLALDPRLPSEQADSRAREVWCARHQKGG